MSSYAETHAPEIARTLETYERLFAAIAGERVDLDRPGAEALAQTASFAPTLAREIEEIARASGIPVERVAALNARTEILAACGAPAAGECSALVVLGGANGPLAVQTWDWHTELAGSWHVRTIEHPDGRVVHTMTEHGIVGKIGVSSAGVGTLFTILKHAGDGGPVGVPVHVVARRILDEAGDVDDALAIAGEASVSASTAITVVSTAGGEPRAASIELYPGGPARVDPDPDGVLAHTNHFLAPAPLRPTPARTPTRSAGSRSSEAASTAAPGPISPPRSSCSPRTPTGRRSAAIRSRTRRSASATRRSRRCR